MESKHSSCESPLQRRLLSCCQTDQREGGDAVRVKLKAGLTGDVAVVVCAVVVLQEGHECVQEVMRAQEHQLLQHI